MVGLLSIIKIIKKTDTHAPKHNHDVYFLIAT